MENVLRYFFLDVLLSAGLLVAGGTDCGMGERHTHPHDVTAWARAGSRVRYVCRAIRSTLQPKLEPPRDD